MNYLNYNLSYYTRIPVDVTETKSARLHEVVRAVEYEANFEHTFQ